MKICTYCRREIDDKIIECPYCGASEFTEKSQNTFKEQAQASIVNKNIKPTSSAPPGDIIESMSDKRESLIYRIIKYILLGIFFYFLILVILAIIVLVYVAVTGNIPGFLPIS